MELNQKDKIILESLFQNCKTTLKELSKRTNLTHPAILHRIKKYEEQKLILKYDTLINLNKLKIPFNVILVSVPEKSKISFEKHCLKNKAIMSVLRHMHKFNYSITSPLTENQEKKLIAYLKKHKFKFKNYQIKKTFSLPINIFNNITIQEKQTRINPRKLKLDKKDIQLIKILYNGGARDSMLKLARKTRLSADLVTYRIRKLTKAGYFDKSIAQPNLEKFKIKYEIIYIETKNYDPKECAQILQKTNKCSYLFVIGKNKYIATLVIKNLKELEETLEKIHKGIDEDLTKLEIYPTKNWLFLNRLNLKEVLI